MIIVAGGRGLRFGGTTPKQFLPVVGKPLIHRIIDKFWRYDNNMRVVVVFPEEFMKFAETLPKNIEIVMGGDTRFESVRNALSILPKQGNMWIAIHDAVRPLVSIATIKNCFESAKMHGAAIPIVPIIDSLRKKEENSTIAVNRNEFVVVQTPQVFSLEILAAAYRQPYCAEFTDDASVVERAGYKVVTVNGNVENIKITSPIDFLMAEVLLQNNEEI
ncbi:MAG: 2-C-methyl-D-erythritol 4-phosphate cytidylyltransferase [Bacteroidales bacterium]